MTASFLTLSRPALLAAVVLGLVAVQPALAQALEGDGASAAAKAPVVFPGPPQDLLHVHITAGGALQFFIDRNSLSVEPGQVVRYTLVAQVPGGPRNVTYEGINCAQRQWTLYALWSDDTKAWTAASSSDWQRIPENGATRIHATLYGDDLCKDKAVLGTPAAMAQRIQQGLRALPY